MMGFDIAALLGLFGLTNSHLLWTREAYPTRVYQSLGNLAPGAGSDRSSPPDPRGLPEGLAVGDPNRRPTVAERREAMGLPGRNLLPHARAALPPPRGTGPSGGAGRGTAIRWRAHRRGGRHESGKLAGAGQA